MRFFIYLMDALQSALFFFPNIVANAAWVAIVSHEAYVDPFGGRSERFRSEPRLWAWSARREAEKFLKNAKLDSSFHYVVMRQLR